MRKYTDRPDPQASLPRTDSGDLVAELRVAECAEYLAQRLGIPFVNARQRVYHAIHGGLFKLHPGFRGEKFFQAEARRPGGEWLIQTAAFIEYAEGKRHRWK